MLRRGSLDQSSAREWWFMMERDMLYPKCDCRPIKLTLLPMVRQRIHTWNYDACFKHKAGSNWNLWCVDSSWTQEKRKNPSVASALKNLKGRMQNKYMASAWSSLILLLLLPANISGAEIDPRFKLVHRGVIPVDDGSSATAVSLESHSLRVVTCNSKIVY